MSSNTTVRTARRRTLRVAAAALTAVAGLTLTACSGSDDGGAKSAGRTDTDTAAKSVRPVGSSDDAQDSDAQDSAAQGSDARAGAGAQGSDAGVDTKAGAAGKRPGRAGAGVQRCHTSGLKASFAMGEDATPDPNADGPTTTSVVLTNKGSRTCVIGGFPGVDLKPGNGGQSWSLARSSAKHGSITLGPRDSTDFTINLGMAEENEEGSWKPAFAVVTPPNETTALTLKWPWGPLVDQQGATHPATFVNPIG
ncbi:DUF4232 domain-containing protein [Streptomyces sp. NPDC002055]|uniref:DUF4232 domain-containing protein n=1 Tax=Streptomyces sp. NPDC002055 TaxID=3154534 RepID=UPI0033275019